jgi:hypothetical protein
MQQLGADAVLLALFLVGTGLRNDVDGCARHGVDVIVVGGGDRVAELLAYQNRRTLDRDAAAVVAVKQHIGAILGQHPGVCGTGEREQRDEQTVLGSATHAGQLQPQPPPTAPVAPLAPSRDS